jgi:23S rRNA (uracil1939-C5)-methyltransferase
MVGFRERMSSFVADIGRCQVLVPEVGNIIGDLSALISGMSIATRIPQIEVAAGDDCVVLVLRILSPLGAADRAALLEFEQRHKVRWLLQPGGPSTLEPLQGTMPQLWYGLPEYGLRMAFEPADFIQVNGAMNQLLIRHVLELLQLDADSQVLDLFCGLGNFTLPIATRAQRVLGMEGDAGLVARAQANAAANGLDNVQFAAANLAGEGATPRVHSAASGGTWTHVLLDPPRTGALDILPAIAGLGPRRVVYVSCHTGSLARDLGILITEHGFTLAAAGIVDMFPHTSHVESVAVLEGPGVRR